MEAHRDRWRLGRMCSLLDLSRSGFFAWRRRARSVRSVHNEALIEDIRRIYAEGRGEYGSPTICDVLRQEGHLVNHKRIARLMRQVGLRSKVVRRFKRTTRPCKDREAAPNLLRQNFQTDGPNRVWLSDITYISTDEGWLYLTTVEDMWSRRMVGHAITDHLRAPAVVEALEMALGRRKVTPGMILHSDRGKQYVDQRVRAILTAHGITQSMSSTGNCYDNAMAESFFATLKKGHLFWERFRTREEARRKLFEYLEVFYNRVRHRLTAHDRVEIVAECETMDEHRYLQDWCQWLVDELANARTTMAGSSRHGTWTVPRATMNGSETTISIRPAATAKYLPVNWIFELDSQAVFQRFIYDAYGSPDTFIRELIQNAADASRCQMFYDLSNEEKECPQYPTMVDQAKRFCYPITVTLSNTERTNALSGEREMRQVLSVEDVGIGMDKEVIRKYFLQVG
ncbi:MAG: transposase, partial [Bacteroidetes bacterium]|nr:transposase [Bacteroidota bacterium]